MPGNNLPKTILLDLDDTIIAHGAAAGGLWESLCIEYAELIEGIQPDILLKAVTEARDWYWDDPKRHREGRLNLFKARRELVEIAFTRLGIDSLILAHKLADSYSTRREEMATLFPGSVDTLIYLKESGIKMALITNGASDMQRSKINRFGLAQYFENILIEGEFGAGKPDRSVFSHSLEKLGAGPEEAWMVGDDLKRDIAGAREAGIYTVWVDWRDGGLPEDADIQPDRIVSKISELVE